MNEIVLRTSDFYGRIFAEGYIDGTIKVINGKDVSELYLHTEPVTCLCFGQIEQKPILISAGYDGIIAIWQPIDGKWKVIQEMNREQPVLSISISPNGLFSAVVKDRTVYSYQYINGKYNEKVEEEIKGKNVTSLAYNQKDELALGTSTGSIFFPKNKKEIKISSSKVISLASSDYGVAAVCDDSTVKLLNNGTCEDIPTKNKDKPVYVSFTPITNLLQISFQGSKCETWSCVCRNKWIKV